jgi:acetyltransferase-like isoleucine patch superfamily enzyme
MSILKLVTAALAYKYPSLRSWYVRICSPSSLEYAAYLKQHGGFYAMGELNSINVDATFTDPAYVRIGNNCALSACTLLGHDGSVRILNNAFGKKLDSVGKVDIRDNSFIGHGAIVMPCVTIGPNSIVNAGAVVTADVAPGTVVGGNPARFICTTAAMVERMEARSNGHPWNDIIQSRKSAFDASMEPQLVRMRQDTFYGELH